MNNARVRNLLLIVVLILAPCSIASGQQLTLRLDPAQTKAEFELDATMHKVEGRFALKRGEVQFDPSQNKVAGEIVFDATSGQTGNDRRDRKMHKDILQSDQFPEISFRLDKVEGTVDLHATSGFQVHGIITIHGAQHELTSKVRLDTSAQQWTGDARFSIPYVAWGMKDPSNVFLHVGNVVDLHVRFGGIVSQSK